VVVLLSDHGEEFFEHGRFLHTQLYEECLHVPLIIHVPGAETPRRLSEPVGLIDIAPTLLDLVGIESPAQFQGRSLRDILDGRAARVEVFAEKVHGNAENRLDEDAPRHMALYTRGLKGIMKTSLELYDLEDDPGEQHGQVGESIARAEILRRMGEITEDNNRRMRAFYPAGEAVRHPLTEQQIEQLKELGYVE